MKIYTLLRVPAIQTGLFFIIFNSLFPTFATSQNCSNFKVTLESRSYLGGKSFFIWSVKNSKPGNGSSGTSQDLKSWALALNSCVNKKDIISCSYGASLGNWKKYLPQFVAANSNSCITSPSVKFNYGTHGKWTSYYLLVLKGDYKASASDAFLMVGNACCTRQVQGVGCNCTSISAPVVQNGERCGPGVINLSATGCSGGTLHWYANSTGGSPIASGNSYSTSLSATTTYYVSCANGGCVSVRVPVTATVNSLPAAPSVIGDSRCGTGNVNLSAFGCSGGTLKWYLPGGVDPIAQGSAYHPFLFYNSTPLYNTNHQSYYVSCTVDGCESDQSEVVADVLFPGLVPASVDGVSRCGAGQVTLVASCPNGSSPGWYASLNSPPIGFGTSFTTYIENTTSYYVSCPGCGSTAGKVLVIASVDDCSASARGAGFEKETTSQSNPRLTVSASPNPYVGKIKFVIQSPVTAVGTLVIYNWTGQKLRTLYNGQLNKGAEQTVEFDVPENQKSNLIYRLNVGNEVKSGMLIHAK